MYHKNWLTKVDFLCESYVNQTANAHVFPVIVNFFSGD